MIQSFRDAELEIRRLQDQFNKLNKTPSQVTVIQKETTPVPTANKNYITGLVNGSGGVIIGSGPGSVKESSFIYGGDYYLSLGSSTVPTTSVDGHLLYLFNDATTGTTEDDSQIRVESNRLAYLQLKTGSLGAVQFIENGLGAIVADILVDIADGALTFRGPGGAERCRISSAGNFLYGTTTDDGSNLVQINGKTKIFDDLTLVNQLTADNGGTGRDTLTANYTLQGDGTNQVKLINGLNTTYTTIQDAVPTTTTIQYKDWAGSNQSATLVDGVIVTTKDYEFTYGVLTNRT